MASKGGSMKKFLVFLLVTLLAFGLTSCNLFGSPSDSSPKDSGTQQSSQTGGENSDTGGSDTDEDTGGSNAGDSGTDEDMGGSDTGNSTSEKWADIEF